jgi:hypothetical protein
MQVARATLGERGDRLTDTPIAQQRGAHAAP